MPGFVRVFGQDAVSLSTKLAPEFRKSVNSLLARLDLPLPQRHPEGGMARTSRPHSWRGCGKGKKMITRRFAEGPPFSRKLKAVHFPTMNCTGSDQWLQRPETSRIRARTR